MCGARSFSGCSCWLPINIPIFKRNFWPGKVTRVENETLIVPTFVMKVTENLCSWWFCFLQTNFGFLSSHFWWKSFIITQKYCRPELKFETIFHMWLFFVSLWRFKEWHFGQIGTINARYFSSYYRSSGDLIRLRNCSKLVGENLFAKLDMLLRAKTITLCFIWRVAGWIF